MSSQNNWYYNNHAIFQAVGPHLVPDLSMIKDKSIWKIGNGTPILARWVTDFDCGYETDFWACILDKPFQVQELKAKRRYEITKGNRNFFCKKLNSSDLADMYDVYVESLKGYKNKQGPISHNVFLNEWKSCFNDGKSVLLGVYQRDTNILCGYAHCLNNGKYIPISTLKTRVSKERDGVNFALVSGICTYYENDLKNGSYLCDGYRNLVHETAFQDWLEKYFQFRKAYCVLNIKYRGFMIIAIKILYPLRKLINKINLNLFKQVSAICLLEEWKQQCKKAKNQWEHNRINGER